MTKQKDHISSEFLIEGEEELNVVENSKVNRYIYDNIKNFAGKRILEIGSGIGNISKYIIRNNKNKELVILSDISDKYITRLKKRFNGTKIRITKYDLEDKKVSRLKKYKIDTIICLNVLEHIKDDKKALKNMYNILGKNGKLILLVPNLPILYGKLDKKLAHYRRYSNKTLSTKIEKSGFKIKKRFYINFFAIFGWIIKGKILKKKLKSNDLKLYDMFMPIFKFVDKVTNKITGLSIIFICKK